MCIFAFLICFPVAFAYGGTTSVSLPAPQLYPALLLCPCVHSTWLYFQLMLWAGCSMTRAMKCEAGARCCHARGEGFGMWGHRRPPVTVGPIFMESQPPSKLR